LDGSDFRSVISIRITLGLFLAGLLYLSYQVLHLFLPSVACDATPNLSSTGI
jgi:hypothetical protein